MLFAKKKKKSLDGFGTPLPPKCDTRPISPTFCHKISAICK